jgi:Protein of unknown function (DUF433)
MGGKGMAETEILDAYPDLEVEDIREALRYAAEAVAVTRVHTRDLSSWQGRVFDPQLSAALKTQCI